VRDDERQTHIFSTYTAGTHACDVTDIDVSCLILTRRTVPSAEDAILSQLPGVVLVCSIQDTPESVDV